MARVQTARPLLVVWHYRTRTNMMRQTGGECFSHRRRIVRAHAHAIHPAICLPTHRYKKTNTHTNTNSAPVQRWLEDGTRTNTHPPMQTTRACTSGGSRSGGTLPSTVLHANRECRRQAIWHEDPNLGSPADVAAAAAAARPILKMRTGGSCVGKQKCTRRLGI